MTDQVISFLRTKVGGTIAGLALCSILISQIFTFVNQVNAAQVNAGAPSSQTILSTLVQNDSQILRNQEIIIKDFADGRMAMITSVNALNSTLQEIARMERTQATFDDLNSAKKEILKEAK